ncbi:hypothetical protein F4859DRAFT_281699 [Xylaria cf. heliscus]|nr:hypothetical protein F4859DRAFT_281699 [Xylaria cf. heliscus]
MPGSTRARGGPVRPPYMQSLSGGKGSRNGTAGTTRLAMKEKLQEKQKEVIIIESDDNDVSGGSDVNDNLHTPHQPHQRAYPAAPDDAVPKTPIETYGLPGGRIAALMRNADATFRCTPDTPSRLSQSNGLDGSHSLKKTNGLAHRRDGSPMKDAATTGRHLLHTPSTVTPPNSLHGNRLSKSQSNSNGNGLIYEKAETNIRTSQQKPTTTPTSVPVANSRDSSPRPSSSALPPTFLPAVKPRVYSASRPSAKRNIDTGSKKLEAFGFVSAASLIPATTKWNATIIPSVANTQNAASAALTSKPTVKPEPVSKPIPKPIKQEAVQLLSSRRKSLPQATRNLAAPATASPISNFKSELIKQEAVEAQVSAPQPTPRTPEKPISAKRARTARYSTGTYGDPYAISSDSDSDDNNNRNGKPYSCPPLKSFAEIADTHETASDVEAVLNQFPAWLDSPSPTELRSSYLNTSRPPTSSRPGKRLWGDRVGNRGRVGRDNRHVRFDSGDGFSTSPVPAKRATAPSRLTPFEDRVTSLVNRNTSPIRGILFSTRLTGTDSPTREVVLPKQAGSPITETPSTKRNAFPVHQLTPVHQTTPLDKYNPPLEERSTPRRVEITIPDSDSDLDSDLNEDPKEDMNSNLYSNPHRHHDDNPIQRQESVIRRARKEKRKKRKRNKRNNAERTVARRHRNRDRESWRRRGDAEGD